MTSKRLVILGIAAAGCCLLAVIIGVIATSMPDAVVVATPQQAEPATVAPVLPETTATPPPESTMTPVLPTDTPVPTAPPAPVYQEPVTLLEVSGVGVQVTDNYQVPDCSKAVFYWTASSADGTASLIADLHSVTTGEEYTIVNEFGMDLVGDLVGAAWQPLGNGEYFISTENTDQSWSIRIECQDGQAPAGVGIDVQGQGVFVTPNYELSGCTKSVFMWTAQPSADGTASLIADLVNVNENRSYNLVNEFDMDLTAPLEGEALQTTKPGLYYLVTENTDQSWYIRWQCQD